MGFCPCERAPGKKWGDPGDGSSQEVGGGEGCEEGAEEGRELGGSFSQKLKGFQRHSRQRRNVGPGLPETIIAYPSRVFPAFREWCPSAQHPVVSP